MNKNTHTLLLQARFTAFFLSFFIRMGGGIGRARGRRGLAVFRYSRTAYPSDLEHSFSRSDTWSSRMISPEALHQKGHEFLFPPWSTNLPSRPKRKSTSVLFQTRWQKEMTVDIVGVMSLCLKTTKGCNLCSSLEWLSKTIPGSIVTDWAEMWLIHTEMEQDNESSLPVRGSQADSNDTDFTHRPNGTCDSLEFHVGRVFCWLD